MKKILIMGASGFIGSFLVEEALKRNFEVYAGIRKSSNRKYFSNPDIRFLNMAWQKVSEKLLSGLKKKNYYEKSSYINDSLSWFSIIQP